MAQLVKHVSIYCCIVMLVCSELTLALGFSRTTLRNLRSQFAESEAETDNEFTEEAPPIPPMFRRACNGFPCMYSHLGTKAGRASLYKTLAGFINDCFNDAECDPGRRKRFSNMGSIQRLLNSPIRDLPGGVPGS